jgi:ADP-ribose pyrophosphatase YjhB (NUDIX family)
VCDVCHTVHYENPKIVVGCIPEKDGRVLLCRRAIEPRLGFWTIPAGFLETGETVAEGARREALEETGSLVEIGDLFSVFNLLPYGQVYLIFRARLVDDGFHPTEESLEVRLFKEEEVPWGDLAFETVSRSLGLYFADRAGGRFSLHQGVIPMLHPEDGG